MKTRTTRRHSILRSFLFTAIAVLGLSAALPAAAEARVRVRVKPRVVVAPRIVVKVAPIKATVVVKSARPVQGKYVWVSGHYARKPGCQRVWIAGHWRRIG